MLVTTIHNNHSRCKIFTPFSTYLFGWSKGFQCFTHLQRQSWTGPCLLDRRLGRTVWDSYDRGLVSSFVRGRVCMCTITCKEMKSWVDLIYMLPRTFGHIFCNTTRWNLYVSTYLFELKYLVYQIPLHTVDLFMNIILVFLSFTSSIRSRIASNSSLDHYCDYPF